MSHVLHFYRNVNGVRKRCRLTLDSEWNFLSEDVLEERTHNEHIKADLAASGIGFEEKNGQIVVTSLPDSVRKAFEALVDPKKCWFDGCSAILEEYQNALKTLPQDCPDCQKGVLLRKYRDKLLDAEKRSKT